MVQLIHLPSGNEGEATFFFLFFFFFVGGCCFFFFLFFGFFSVFFSLGGLYPKTVHQRPLLERDSALDQGRVRPPGSRFSKLQHSSPKN